MVLLIYLIEVTKKQKRRKKRKKGFHKHLESENYKQAFKNQYKNLLELKKKKIYDEFICVFFPDIISGIFKKLHRIILVL